MSDHLTHRIEGLADHPAARAQLPTRRIPARPAPKCGERSDRGGSMGPCGGTVVDGVCQRAAQHRPLPS